MPACDRIDASQRAVRGVPAIHNLPLVIANGTTSVLCMVILAFKLRQGR